MRIVTICGSLRRSSYNAGLIRAAAESAPEDVELVALTGIKEVPIFDEDDQATSGFPPAVSSAMDQIRAADAVLISTPEYLYAPPGGLKNLLDWLSFPPPTNVLRFKPVALMGASISDKGTVRSQLILRQSLLFIEAQVLAKPEIYVPVAHTRFDAEGNLLDDEVRAAVAGLVTELRDFARSVALRNLGHERPFLFT
jgi:chromate reductase, NAD(P)H dehydrogenase (quinone)